jgi:hypothetical protein
MGELVLPRRDFTFVVKEFLLTPDSCTNVARGGGR